MKKIWFLFLFLIGCNHNSLETIKQSAVPAILIVDKFKNTNIRSDNIKRGIYDYRDTTFNNEIFAIKDTISYIGTDNQGNEYLLFGKIDGSAHWTVKCYCSDKQLFDELKVNQFVTLYSEKHFAINKIVSGSDIGITVVQMQKCKLIL